MYSDQEAEFVLHLKYLFKLTYRQRNLKESYKELKRILFENDHWKAKSRGKHQKTRSFSRFSSK